MALSDLFLVDSKVRFEVYAQELGNNFNGVTIAAVHSYATAARSGLLDIDAMHQLIYNRLPNNVPNDPKKYGYVEIIGLDGEPKLLGVPWIKEGSIVKVTEMYYSPKIKISATSDITIINQVLIQAGFEQIIASNVETL